MPLSSSAPRGFIGLASVAIVLWLLWWLQAVLIPVALAILLTFWLSPPVRLLQRYGFSRVPAVMLVALVALSCGSGIGWLVGRQVSSLIDTFPQYEKNLAAKIAVLRRSEDGWVDKLENIVQRLTRELERKPSAAEVPDANRPVDSLSVTIKEGPFQLSKLWSAFAPVLQPVAALGLAVVLVIFMLIRREDLRDRVISLVGHGRLTFTTKALDEAGERISRYLLMQLVVNASYGITVAIGLYLIGLPYALLWGFFAAVLRYIPYLGAWLAAIFPIGLSLLISEGWTAPLLVVGLFLTLELISNLAVEPWLYGRGIGVSETATLVMVAFWTWLWGPVGLILATPLTVCLVVLGKYVPHLGFFDTLLGDRPALETHVGYYQRLLARDQDEAADIAAQHLKGNSLAATFDSLLIPALAYAKHDLERDVLSKEDQRFVVDATRDAVEELVTLDERTHQADEQTQEAAAESARALVRILGCPARDDSDQVALLMLKQLLDPKCYDLSLTTTALLSSEVITHVGDARPAVVCIAALPPGGVAQTRLLCLRLHARFPDMKILIGRWGATDNVEKTREQLLAAGADQIATTLEDTCDRLAALRPILVSHESQTDARADAQGEEAAALTRVEHA